MGTTDQEGPHLRAADLSRALGGGGGGLLAGGIAAPAPSLGGTGSLAFSAGVESPVGPAAVTAADNAGRAHQALARGSALYNRGQFRAALGQFQEAVRIKPDESRFHCCLAAAAERLGQGELVERHLLEALRLDPGQAHAHTSLGMHYQNAGRLDLALEHTARAVALRPGDVDAVTYRAFVLHASGDTDGAWELVRPLVNDPAARPDRWLAHVYGRLAPRLGQEEQALAFVRRAMAAPGLPDAPDGRPMLHFSAAALLDRLGRYDEAFEQATLGNRATRPFFGPHDPEAFSRFASQVIAYFSRDRMAALPRATHGDRRPVFIVGMPRSGTSLVEQILASHPEVFGAGELNLIPRTAMTMPASPLSEGDPYPQCLEGLTLREANRLAGAYLASVEALNADAVRVTDKMPHNFLSLGLIEVLFPGSRVIHCTRGAMDTCLSCYFTNFVRENEFKFDLAHLGAYYRDYRRLMEHWRNVVRIPIIELRYEDLVLDVEGQTRRLLDFVGLPFDARCLRYYENRRQVGTASEEQVRRPVYHSSISRWKHYEKHLGPVVAAIGGGQGSAASDGPRAAFGEGIDDGFGPE
ncbi:MAG TPA: sulfotransferase [Tepidisphaeraceae bacterium]